MRHVCRASALLISANPCVQAACGTNAIAAACRLRVATYTMASMQSQRRAGCVPTLQRIAACLFDLHTERVMAVHRAALTSLHYTGARRFHAAGCLTTLLRPLAIKKEYHKLALQLQCPKCEGILRECRSAPLSGTPC